MILETKSLYYWFYERFAIKHHLLLPVFKNNCIVLTTISLCPLSLGLNVALVRQVPDLSHFGPTDPLWNQIRHPCIEALLSWGVDNHFLKVQINLEKLNIYTLREYCNVSSRNLVYFCLLKNVLSLSTIFIFNLNWHWKLFKFHFKAVRVFDLTALDTSRELICISLHPWLITYSTLTQSIHTTLCYGQGLWKTTGNRPGPVKILLGL